MICQKVEEKYEDENFGDFDDVKTEEKKVPLKDLVSQTTKNNFTKWSAHLNIITIHQIRKTSMTLAYAYDAVAAELCFDNSGDKNSDLLTLLKFYHHFAGDKLTENNFLKDTIKEAEVNQFINHLQTSVQDTKLLKALTNAIKTVKKHYLKI